ncbi:MAG: Dockerin type domain, partial [Planctomycetota bacterium]
FEWSADCNSDGIVDYGQIRSGELADANGNYIPDCCEATPPCGPCLADVDGSGAVNGVDLAAILNTWGTTGGKYPGADVNSDGIVNGADLAEVLNSWGPCP